MRQCPVSYTHLKKHIAEEKFAEAKFEFAEEAKAEVPEEYDTSWTEELDANTKGEYRCV